MEVFIHGLTSKASLGERMATCGHLYTGISRNGESQKWLVYKGNPFKIGDLGVPYFRKPSYV